jgi:hypothetical protein
MEKRESYTKAAADMLKRVPLVEVAKDALRQEIEYLRDELSACRLAALVGNREEDRRNKLMGKLEDASFRLRELEKETEKIRRGMDALNPYQQDLLDMFFVRRRKDCLEELSERYRKERSAIYRDRKAALETFTIIALGALPC